MDNLHFYGERGIVNGLVLDIKDDLELGKAVINSISWCDHSDADWISEKWFKPLYDAASVNINYDLLKQIEVVSNGENAKQL